MEVLTGPAGLWSCAEALKAKAAKIKGSSFIRGSLI
jgi:hypothetical protein